MGERITITFVTGHYSCGTIRDTAIEARRDSLESIEPDTDPPTLTQTQSCSELWKRVNKCNEIEQADMILTQRYKCSNMRFVYCLLDVVAIADSLPSYPALTTAVTPA